MSEIMEPTDKTTIEDELIFIFGDEPIPPPRPPRTEMSPWFDRAMNTLILLGLISILLSQID